MRLIDADAMKERFCDGVGAKPFDWVYDIHDLAGALAEMPTIDAVPVVRCGDCKFGQPWYADKSRCFLWHESGIDVFNDGYCSYGKRKEDTK